HVHHRFDCEREARDQLDALPAAYPWAACGPPVRNLRLLVHVTPDAMARVLAHDAIAVAFDERLYRARDVADFVPSARLVDPDLERLLGDFQQPLRLGRDLADANRQRGVSHLAVVDGAAVQAVDVTFLQDAVRARDAVNLF